MPPYIEPAPIPTAPLTGRTRRGRWLALFAVAFLLRAGYATVAAGPAAVPSSDPAHYDTIAWNLARGEGYSLESAGGSYPTSYRPPLVPWITSLLYRVVGHRYFAALLLHAAIGALVPLAIAALGGVTYGVGIGWTAAWLTAVNPLLIFLSGYLLTENTFTLLLLVALRLSADWVKTPRRGRALGLGLIWGLDALARPVALLLPAVVALWAWVPLGLALGDGERRRNVALLLLGVALAVGPWTLRNAFVMHAFVPVSTNSGRVLLEGWNPRSWFDPAYRGGGAIDNTIEPYASFLRLPEPEADRRSRAEAVRFAREHAGQLPAVALAKLGRFWRMSAEGGGTGVWLREDSPLRPLLGWLDPVRWWAIVLFPLALWGALRTLRGTRRWFQSLPLWVIAYFSILAMVFWGGLRPRAPIEPLIALLAAAGFEDIRRRVRSRAAGMRAVQSRL